jgi:hypothetical protein
VALTLRSRVGTPAEVPRNNKSTIVFSRNHQVKRK